MAILPSPSPPLKLQLISPFPSPFASTSRRPHALQSPPRATTEPSGPTDQSEPEPKPSDPDAFEARLDQVRFRYRSGKGKKAERRKSRKSRSSSGASVFLPPVALKEAVSRGLKVEFGFSRYSERLNGRIAILGLTALVLVEVATGKGVISFHTPAVVLVQIYFVAAVSALYAKYEKERISVWPPSSPSKG
ncbi:uncharacterized protein LOC131167060 [Malania oleifera]|uniref:uncharacterized protein LOC131167060 n=1 Tax=Malania oleifera TaxID=397392 RepID=UPI0025AE3BA9|nr:uncharacterized protein LOC131167060 [Malania oleifera]